MSLRIRSTNTNSENNVAALKGKTALSNVGFKRPALGEIGNKVVSRSNNALGKPGTRQVLKPAVKPSEASLSSKTTVSVAPKPTDVPKVVLKTSGTTRNPKSSSTSSTESVILPRRKELDTESAYSTKTLEPHVFDVDKQDEDNPLLVGYYVCDIYKYLRSLEEKFPIQEGFLAGQEVTPHMRATLVDWLVDVQQQYHLLQETLYLCIQIQDRYLQTVRDTSRKFLQLVGVTAMYMACKYEEIYSPDIADFVYITDKAYSKRELLKMEQQMANALGFEFSRPISLTFLRRYSKIIGAEPLHHCFSKYFLELALMEYSLSHVNPSLVAAASLYVAVSIRKLKGIPAADLWDAKMEYYSSYSQKEVEQMAKKLASVILKAMDSKFQAVRKKYSSSKMMKVSWRPELDSDIMRELAQ